MFQTTLFSWFEVAKILLFHKLKNFFSTFFHFSSKHHWLSMLSKWNFMLLFRSRHG